ncbi:MAG: stage 0 sporulation family protein [Actinomycetales bacterium]
MTSIVAVAYVKHGRLHYASPGTHQLAVGDKVVVPVAGVDRVGTVLWGPTFADEPLAELPQVLRVATPEDIEAAQDAERRAVKARTAAKRAIRKRALPMQVLGSEWVPGDQRVTIWFSAPRRIDFRELLRSLTAEIGMRVLLRQVSERERAKVVGGVGVCGRELCCATFLDTFEPVSLQMARDQHLGTDPLRIAGACGRLMCCLRYEHPAYADFTARAPHQGADGGCSQADSCGSRASFVEKHSR